MIAHRVVTMLVAVLVAAGCVLAGVWQWGRHEDRSATAALLATNYDAGPVPVADVLTPALADDDAWRPVTLTGRYVGDPVVLRGRPVAGGPAVQVLGLVEITSGTLAGETLVVDRGWLRLTPDEGLPTLPPLPEDPVDLVVRLRPLEPGSAREAAPGETYRVAPRDLARAGVAGVDRALPAYGVVRTEDGAAPPGLRALPEPTVTIGVNLSYAFQWWLFAAGALAGGVLLLRQPANDGTRDQGRDELADSAGDAAAAPGIPPAPKRPARARRRPTAEEEEDAIVDAQESASSPSPHRRTSR